MSLIIFVSGISLEIQQSFEVDSSTDNWHDNGVFFLYGIITLTPPPKKKIKNPPKKTRNSKKEINTYISKFYKTLSIIIFESRYMNLWAHPFYTIVYFAKLQAATLWSSFMICMSFL